MNIAFAGFRHNHIYNLYKDAENNEDVSIVMCFEEDEAARRTATETCGACFNLPTYWNFCFWGSEGMLNFRYTDSIVHIYKDSETTVDCGEIINPAYFEEFIKEIEGKPSIMSTIDILESQRQVLMIQKESEKNG